MAKKEKKKKRAREDIAAMAAAVEQQAASAAATLDVAAPVGAVAQAESPSPFGGSASQAQVMGIPSMFSVSPQQQPQSRPEPQPQPQASADDSAAHLSFDSESDSVTRIDFSSSSDDVIRLDFSAPSFVEEPVFEPFAASEPSTGAVSQPESVQAADFAPQFEPAPQSAAQAKTRELTEEERAADRAQAASKPTAEQVAAAKSGLERIVANVETVVIGKREPVSLVVLALIARGHVLLEDLPGTGKTTLVSALARSIDCGFSRIQFTPDIMPSDVSGFSIYNQKTNDFEFRPGGVMSNLVLADEINRASAKTQSALLEAMEERQVTVDGQTYRLPEPFMVLATQNPIEQFGTYPLPEAQVDRFLVKLSMGYPAFEQEVRVLELGDKAKKALRPVVSSQDVLALRETAARVYASRIVLRYIVEVITATRDNPEMQVGSSPRGGIALLALARAYALFQGRAYVIPDDVKALAPHVLCHRISLAHEAKVAGRTERQVIESILSGIAVPYYDEQEAQGIA